MADFTATQGRYLAFIHAYTHWHGRPPAEAEIALALCVSPPSVNQVVKTLEKNGLILRHPGQPRALQILIPEDEIPPWKDRKSARKPELAGPIKPSRRDTRTPAAPAASLYVISVYLLKRACE
jgi:SOS-response transcriptional repressor LexA